MTIKGNVSQTDSPLAIISMLLGALSLITIPTGFGFVLGIPAIIMSAVALKKGQGGHNLSLSGLITGACSTAASVLVALFIGTTGFLQQTHPEYFHNDTTNPEQTEQRFHSSQL